MPEILSASKARSDCEVVPKHLKLAAGVSFEQLMDRIPPRFSLMASPERVFRCSELAKVHDIIAAKHDRGLGSDLICSTD